MSIFTLDIANNIVFDKNNRVLANPHALRFLSEGLYNLAWSVKVIEGMALRVHPPGTIIWPGSRLDPTIMCKFHWFSTSLVNYMRLVGLIKLLYDTGKTEDDIPSITGIGQIINNYVRGVIPDILEWRHKVSAHFSATHPQSDNLATVVYSIMDQSSFGPDANGIGRLSVSEMKLGSGGTSSTLSGWSITSEYERLIPNYWPGAVLHHNQALCVAPTLYNNGP
ncbi:MAG: hypothetical protein WCJ64_03510 [Rhodospirillaceae bacterium]